MSIEELKLILETLEGVTGHAVTVVVIYILTQPLPHLIGFGAFFLVVKTICNAVRRAQTNPLREFADIANGHRKRGSDLNPYDIQCVREAVLRDEKRRLEEDAKIEVPSRGRRKSRGKAK